MDKPRWNVNVLHINLEKAKVAKENAQYDVIIKLELIAVALITVVGVATA